MNQAKIYLDSLSYEEQTKLLLNLTKYAKYKAKQKEYWRTGNHLDLPKGETADSVVSLAFEEVLTPGDDGRNWNPETAPDFYLYMQSVIDSKLYHLATGKDNTIFLNQNNRKFAANYDGAELLDVAEEKFVAAKATRKFEDKEWLVREQLSLEDELIAAEQKEFYDQVLKAIFDAAAGDAEVSGMLDAMDYNYNTSREIANFKEIDVDRIYNARKRLNTIVSKVKQKFDI
jgi:hypothetical protein